MKNKRQLKKVYYWQYLLQHIVIWSFIGFFLCHIMYILQCNRLYDMNSIGYKNLKQTVVPYINMLLKENNAEDQKSELAFLADRLVYNSSSVDSNLNFMGMIPNNLIYGKAKGWYFLKAENTGEIIIQNMSDFSQEKREQILDVINTIGPEPAFRNTFDDRTYFSNIERKWNGIPEKMYFAINYKFTDKNGDKYILGTYEEYSSLRPAWLAQILEEYTYLLLMLLALPFITAGFVFMRKRYLFMTAEYRNALMNTMAHDLKSPLTAIGGYAENLKALLKADMPEIKPEDKRLYYSNCIIENVGYMNELMNRNLEMLQYKKRKLIKKKVDVRECFEKTLERYRILIDENKLQVNLSGNMTAIADEELLQEAIDNFVTNAISYSCKNGKIEAMISDHIFMLSNETEIEYSGNLNRLWEPLERGEDSRNGRGNGMGLAIAAEILKRHKWKYKLKYDLEEKIFTVIVKIPRG